MAASAKRPLVFNTPFESGIRSLIILTQFYPQSMTLRKVVLLDYLVVHTEDIGGPLSLHPPEDFRAAELLVRRDLVSTGLLLMTRKAFVVREPSKRGFCYAAGEEAGSFVDLLSSEYNSDLKKCSKWLLDAELKLGEGGLESLLKERKGIWLPEFQSGAND